MIRMTVSLAALVLASCNTDAPAPKKETVPEQFSTEVKAKTIAFCMITGQCAIQALDGETEGTVTYSVYRPEKYIGKLVSTTQVGMLMAVIVTPNGCGYSLVDYDLNGAIDKTTVIDGDAKKCAAELASQDVYEEVLDIAIEAIQAAESAAEEDDTLPDEEKAPSTANYI